MNCRNLLQEQEVVEKQNNGVTNNTDVNDLRRHVEVNVDSEQPLKKTNDPSDDNFGNLNNGSIVERMRYSLHSSTSPGSNNSSLNKDKNTLELSRETRHDTSELAEETGQENETVDEIPEPTITGNEDNIKRGLPEGFEETNKHAGEGLSEVVSDSIPPEKRRKTRHVTTSYTEEGVLNNNDRTEESANVLEQEKLGEVSSEWHNNKVIKYLTMI
jgi:hypothetical protein